MDYDVCLSIFALVCAVLAGWCLRQTKPFPQADLFPVAAPEQAPTTVHIRIWPFGSSGGDEGDAEEIAHRHEQEGGRAGDNQDYEELGQKMWPWHPGLTDEPSRDTAHDPTYDDLDDADDAGASKGWWPF